MAFGNIQRRRLHDVSGQPVTKISPSSLNPVLMQCTRGKALRLEAAREKNIYPSNEPKHCVHRSKTDTSFCQEKNNCRDRTRNRKVMVIEAVRVPGAWFLPCSSCKGSKGGRTASQDTLTTEGFEMWSYLRSDKVGSVAGSHEQPVLCSQLLGKPKVTDPDRVWVS